MFNPLTQGYDKIFKSDANNHIDEYHYTQKIKLEPNGIYSWDPLNKMIELMGHLKDEKEAKENKEENAGANCDMNNYKGPEFDIQFDSQCKAAYLYKCAGNQKGLEATCAIYKNYQKQDPSIPNCPYCN